MVMSVAMPISARVGHRLVVQGTSAARLLSKLGGITAVDHNTWHSRRRARNVVHESDKRQDEQEKKNTTTMRAYGEPGHDTSKLIRAVLLHVSLVGLGLASYCVE